MLQGARTPAGRPHGPHAARARGFTLLEILVVMVIIALIATMASITISRDHGAVLKEEAERLVALMRLASDESVLTAATIGMRFESDRYGFLTQVENQWLPIENDRYLRERELPEPLRLELTSDGTPFNQRASGSRIGLSREEAQGERPQVVFVSTGEIEPGFELRLEHPDLDLSYLITALPDGRIELRSEDED